MVGSRRRLYCIPNPRAPVPVFPISVAIAGPSAVGVDHLLPVPMRRSLAHPVLVSACAGLLAIAAPASAQQHSAALKEIGTTSTGDPVLLETKSVKTAQGIITAAIRARFAKPTKASMGDLYASRTIAMFDCAKQVVAVKENWYYFDQAGTKPGPHKVVGIPGFAPAFKGSVPDVAMGYLCKAP